MEGIFKLIQDIQVVVNTIHSEKLPYLRQAEVVKKECSTYILKIDGERFRLHERYALFFNPAPGDTVNVDIRRATKID